MKNKSLTAQEIDKIVLSLPYFTKAKIAKGSEKNFKGIIHYNDTRTEDEDGIGWVEISLPATPTSVMEQIVKYEKTYLTKMVKMIK